MRIDLVPHSPWDFVAFGSSLLAVFGGILAAADGQDGTALAAVIVAMTGLVIPVLRIWTAERKAEFEREDIRGKLESTTARLKLAITAIQAERHKVGELTSQNADLKHRIEDAESRLDKHAGKIAKNEQVLQQIDDSGHFPPVVIDPEEEEGVL